ncbi:MAG: hypoxanthine-guanine phosphoribosyltransferase [Gammaproteobacteria bacterium]
MMPAHIQNVFAKATCLYSNDEINTALDAMAAEIRAKLENTNPVLLCVLKGGIVLTGNLLPRLDFPLELDCVHATRYRGALSGGEISWQVIPNTILENRTVLIVDDILDGGITLSSIIEYCKNQKARAIYTAVLLDKPAARLAGGLLKADFTGLEVENRYVFGYGLDYKEYLRNAPGIYEVASEHQ